MDQEKLNDTQANQTTGLDTTQSNIGEQNTSPVVEKDNKTKNPRKKFSKPGIITIAILLLAFLVIGTIPIINNFEQHESSNPVSYYEPKEQSSPNNENKEDKTTKKPSTTSEGLPDCSKIEDQVEIDVCETIAGVAEYLVNEHYPTDGQIVLDYNYKENEGVVYKPDYLIMATESIPGHSAYELKSKYTDTSKYLLDNGFVEVTRIISGGLWDISTYINYDNGVICEGGAILTCNSITWYPSENSNNLELLNNLAEAAIKKGWDPNQYVITATVNDIKDSEILPYQTINVGGTNAGVSFYRINSSSDWELGYVTQSVMLCSDFADKDKQKAYASETCAPETTGNTLTTVKEYYNV